MEKLVAPPLIAARRRLRCFHQQETKQAVTLFTNVSQPRSFSAGIFFWNQSEIASNLLPTWKSLRIADDPYEGQCGEWTFQPSLTPSLVPA